VAGILTFLKLDVPAIVAGLLHDTLEDTVATRAELEHEFGSDVARLVEGVTKIGQIPFKTYGRPEQVEKQERRGTSENDAKLLVLAAGQGSPGVEECKEFANVVWCRSEQ
jgi:GTP pyrophosphokinase